jgi:serine/threonine-protein kinase
MSDKKKKDPPALKGGKPGAGVKLTPPPRAEVPAVFAKAKSKAKPGDTPVPGVRPLVSGLAPGASTPERRPSGKQRVPPSGASADTPRGVPADAPRGVPASGAASDAPRGVPRGAPPPPPVPGGRRAGMRIGDYTIDEEIGAGGMSVIYRSHQTSLGRTVAVKVLRPEIAAQPHLVERFEREATSLATLQHENILHIYDYRTDGEVPFMVTELVEGVDLYDVLERHERLPVDVAAVVVAQVARALDYAHSRGVIHRDVKPANIMFTAQGGIKLMDFGIARQTDGPDLTLAGAGVGTPAYMSPEQILCEAVDGRTDIWSLGVVLYQAVTGRKPFLPEEHRSVLHKIRVDKPTAPRQLNSAVPRALERIILRCLEKRPLDRYPVAQQLALALERFVAARVAMGHQAQLLCYLQSVGEFSAAQVEAALPASAEGGQRATFPRPPRRHSERPPLGVPWAGWVGAVSGVLLLTLLVVVLASWPSAQAPRQRRPCPTPAAGGVAAPVGVPDKGGDVAAVPAGHGGLRVVAHPWAEVLVAGRVVETTPFDRPVPLAAGTHQVVLRHPKLGRVTRAVEIPAGQVVTVLVDLFAQRGGKDVKP